MECMKAVISLIALLSKSRELLFHDVYLILTGIVKERLL